MSELKKCSSWLREVDWDMIHEDAVTMYLEWGNNNFHDALRRPVVSGDEYSVYFVVDTWEKPKVVLMKMNNYGSQGLCEQELPEDLAERFFKENGRLKGVFSLTDEVKEWVRTQVA